MNRFPNLKRWFYQVGSRDATIRAYAKGLEVNVQPTVSGDAARYLFGQDANTVK